MPRAGSPSLISQLSLDRKKGGREPKATSQEALSAGKAAKAHYRIVVMGAAGVGKSAIVSQFLYDTFQVNILIVSEIYNELEKV